MYELILLTSWISSEWEIESNEEGSGDLKRDATPITKKGWTGKIDFYCRNEWPIKKQSKGGREGREEGNWGKGWGVKRMDGWGMKGLGQVWMDRSPINPNSKITDNSNFPKFRVNQNI